MSYACTHVYFADDSYIGFRVILVTRHSTIEAAWCSEIMAMYTIITLLSLLHLADMQAIALALV